MNATAMNRKDLVPIQLTHSLRLASLAFAAAVSLAAAGSAGAQDTQAPSSNSFGPRMTQSQGKAGPAPEVISTHGDWKVQCEAGGQQATNGTDPAPAKQCGMVQTAH